MMLNSSAPNDSMREQRYGMELKAGACDKSDIVDQNLNTNQILDSSAQKIIKSMHSTSESEFIRATNRWRIEFRRLFISKPLLTSRWNSPEIAKSYGSSKQQMTIFKMIILFPFHLDETKTKSETRKCSFAPHP